MKTVSIKSYLKEKAGSECECNDGTTSIEWDSILDFGKMWEQYGRIIKPKGVMCLFGSQPFSAQLICSKLKWFRYELVWNKFVKKK